MAQQQNPNQETNRTSSRRSEQRTGETPSRNKGFSQMDEAGENEMSQRVAQDAFENEREAITSGESSTRGETTRRASTEEVSSNNKERGRDNQNRERYETAADEMDDEFESNQPHRKDPSSINQVNNRKTQPDIQMGSRGSRDQGGIEH